MISTRYILNLALLLLMGTVTAHAQTIKGTIYGGGEMAKVDGKTNVKLNTGTVEQDVFGGGKGKLNGDHTVNMSADVSETTTVTANGTTFKFPEEGIDKNVNHNIYGGGNLACKIGTLDGEGNLVDETGNTTVNIYAGLMKAGFMDGDATTAWGKWIDAVNTRISTQHDNIVQGSVFGGGYGVNTSVMGMATVNINVANTKANKAMVDVVGGGYNGYVLSKTSVTVEGVPEIYKIYGGGLGSRDGYTNAPTTLRTAINTLTMQQTVGAVGEGKDGDGTNVLIKGGKFYNDIFGGGAGLKYNGETSYLNVAEVFGTTVVEVDAPSWIDGDKFSKNIYGGGALGLVSDDIYVTLKSGEFAGAQVFGGSLGEMEHPNDKAKVGGNTHVLVTHNDATPAPDALKGHLDIYGGCDMAWVDNDDSKKGNTNVKVEYGTFYGSIFGAGKGIPSTDADNLNADHGKVTGNTSVIIDGGADWASLTLGAPDKYTAAEATEANTASGIAEGQPGYVREGDYKTPIKVYGGSALGLIGGTLDVKLKSGTLYGEMFGGSLGELGYVEKAKVTTTATISTEAGSVDSETGKPYPLKGLFNIYGGCDMAQIENNTHVNLLHGTFSGNIFGGGKGVNELSTTEAGDEEYLNYGKVIGETSIVLDAPEIVLGENDIRDTDGNITEEKPKVGIYGGGALGMVEGTIKPVTLKSGTLYGSIFGGSLGEKGHVNKAMVTGNTAVKTMASETNKTTVKDAGNNDVEIPAILQGIFHIYGGCDMAQVKGNTDVTIQHGTFEGEIYGGGRGLASEGGEDYMDYGCVFGKTKVLYENDNNVAGQGTFNGDIYGGGALGLVCDPIDADKPNDWVKPDYITEVHLKKGDLNGKVFGGGLGEKVNVAKAMVTGNTLVTTDEANSKLGGDINNLFGGGNMAQVDGNTRVEITHGSFSGTIFGGGNGIYEEPGTQTGDEQYTDFGKVTGETYVLIDGPNLKLGKATYYSQTEADDYNEANDLHDANLEAGTKADPDFKRKGDWKTIESTMSIYGGGALGMVGKSITVEVKSGEIYGAVFAGSKGEKGHVAKALVTTEGEKKVTVKTIGSTVNKKSDGTTPADLKGDFKVYGGCDLAMFEGTSEVVINHGTFSGEIYGGGNGLSFASDGGETRYGQITGTSKVIIDIANEGRFNGDIYGGGALGLVVPTGFDKASYALPAPNADAITTVYLSKGEVNGNVFGGSLGEKIAQEKAMVYGNTLVTTDVPDDYITGSAGNIGGRIENFFGGGNMASVNGHTKVHVNRGHFNGRIFGGGNGIKEEQETAIGSEQYLDFGKVLGSSNVLIDGDATLKLGESAKYTAAEATAHNNASGIKATPGDVNYVQEGDFKKPMKIYGGGALGKVEGIINIAIKNGEHYGEVFGGSLGEKGHPQKALVSGNTNAWAVANKLVNDDPTQPANDAMPLTGELKFYGGCEMARVEGQSKVTINHGTFSGAIYGGGKGIPTYNSETFMDYGKVIGSGADDAIASVVDFNNANGTFTGNIYGGGALGMIEKGIANVQMKAGTVKGNVYGGSYGENTLPAKGTAAATLVEMLGGSVNAVADTELKGEVYGGGALANIAGSTEVHLYGGTVGGNVFGGGLGNATTYQEVGGNTKVILGTDDYTTASVIDGGSIFGANNINGTPRGRSFVHVRRTVQRSTNKSLDPTERSKENDDDTDSYDVFAVYGGGNLSAYQPSDATYTAGKGFATVLVENCDNSIAYVYGGGNAAPVPGTDVKIYGADAINHAFAGGNGKGVGNDGADVGYLGFYSTPTPAATEYGSGKARIAVYGGTVHNVYGGSNTLGYIRTSSSVNVADPEEGDQYAHNCPLKVGKTFGGGNEADIVGDIEMCLSCTAGADIVFAGANNANVYGDIHLAINSGTFRQVFCSNNMGGAVFGKLQLDVEEIGCTPIIIKELFGGGNLAPYSVYGYNDDGTCKTSGDQLYADPVVNIYSCTAIGTVYGGGFGSQAVMYGNPIVNVDMVKGKFASRTITSLTEDYDYKQAMVISNGFREQATSISIPNDIGTIGNIFGGGKEADVYGNTTVNVCVNHPERSALISPFQGGMTSIMSFSDAEVKDVPTGSVYGGGKMANVFGNTRVHIRNGNIEGNVFGAGQGDAGQPDAALVQGKTQVIIGE